MQPRASCTAISARRAGDESASELAYSDAGHTQTQGSFGQPDATGLAGPAQPIFTAHQMGLCTFCLDCQPCPVSTSLAHRKEALKISTRGCTMLPRCDMTTPPSLSCVYTQAPLKIIMTSCKQKPFWAVIVIGSTERARQCTTTPRFRRSNLQPVAVDYAHA